MSETVERSTHGASRPPGEAGQGNGLLAAGRHGLTIFLRQREATIFLVALALFIYFSLANSNFLGNTNLANLLSGFAAPIIIIAIGEVLLLICGEIDLSVGFTFLFAPYLMHYLIDFYGVPGILAIIISLVFGLVVGLINGFLTVTVGLPSFITTLGTGFILWGLTNTTSHAEPANIPGSVKTIGRYFGAQSSGGLLNWSAIIWAIALVIIFHIVLTRTRWGLHTVSVGGNQLGAREAGISVARIKYGNFMITGLMGAIVGLQVAFYDSTIDPGSGQWQPMFYSVTAAVIGGTAMLGGSGTILGGLLGALVLAELLDGFNIIGISSNPLYMIFGAAVLVAMIANVQLTRLREAGRS